MMTRIPVLFLMFNAIMGETALASEYEFGHQLPLYSISPFVLILLAIALMPLILRKWWESNLHKLYISIALSIPVLYYYLSKNPHSLIVILEEYSSFIILLASLYIISGGVVLRGDIAATPLVNTIILAIGSILASFIGTTGASMLLIRPILRINSERRHIKHTVIFFIFLVSNIGGCLTPLGDPPLYMGYLEGVPFSWTFKLFANWLFMVSILLAAYYIMDSIYWKKEPIFSLEREKLIIRPLSLLGSRNIILIAGIVACVAFIPYFPYRELIMIALAVISFRITPQQYRKENDFTSYPIKEVAVLFLGIFITMIPALDVLRARGYELGIKQAWHFFWATGILSSVLDNTPTYLVFISLARGLELKPEIIGISQEVLKAISLGAVFMGANTYIGNGPNFMVKSIAEERGVEMPGFFGYIFYSLIILFPLYILYTVIFL